MPFSSPEFILLVLGTALLLGLLRGTLRWLTFLGASLWFVWSHVGTTGLLCCLLFAACGFLVARLAISRPRVRPFGIALLTIVFVYLQRYAFLESWLPSSWLDHALRTAGLSFLFFKIVHVIVDCGSRTLPELRLPLYLAYCFNFTAFLMGPIQRYPDFRDQWDGTREAIPDTLVAHLDAINRILLGMVKVYVLGEMIAPWILSPAHDLAVIPWDLLALKTYLFYVHLYLNFSGYCDIVIGAGCLLGVRPPENFHFPFLAGNIAQFWLRVHRSLTTWLTDYVFNPLFARSLRWRTRRFGTTTKVSLCLLVTMLVSGLWHGTTWNFLLFGLVHAAFLIVYRVYDHLLQTRLGRVDATALRVRAYYRVAATTLTFAASGGAYLFFATTTEQLAALYARITG